MNFKQELKLFTAKLLIVAALCLVPFATTLLVLNSALSSISSRLATDFPDPVTWAAKISAKIETMNPEKREVLHRSLASIATQLRPFIEDLRPVIEPNENRASKPTCNP